MIIATREDGAALVILAVAAACPTCRRAAFFVVNRNGRTLCVHCDEATR
jgi:hypothetical protein